MPPSPRPAGKNADERDAMTRLGTAVRRLRTQRGLSLKTMALASGVSRAMLWQVERGRSAPTLQVLWRIARTLQVSTTFLVGEGRAPRATVLRRAEGREFTSKNGALVTRVLCPGDAPHGLDLVEHTFAAGFDGTAERYPSGALMHLVVEAGALDVQVADEAYSLEVGDAIVFAAEAVRRYRNARDVAARVLVLLLPGRPLVPACVSFGEALVAPPTSALR